MRTRTLAAAGLAAAGLLGIAACDPADTPSVNGTSHAGATTTAATGTVPRLVGMGLQSAQDAARAKGFHHLTSHDSAGRDRLQLFDRDWKVCSQQPAAGAKVSTDTKLDLGAVKTGETCPSTDRKPPPKTGRTMPDFVGRSLNTAAKSLPSDASVASVDASGKHRLILLLSNWKICTQSPKPGAAFSGQPVKFTVVEFDESCP